MKMTFSCSTPVGMLRRCAGKVALITALILATAVAQFPLAAAVPQPARVQLSTFEALDAGGQVLVRWESSLESGVVNYNLYRQADGQWQRVNSKPLPAMGQIFGAVYQTVDASGTPRTPSRYKLEIITLSGQPQSLEARELTPVRRVGASDLSLASARALISPLVGDETDDDRSSPSSRNAVLAGAGAISLPGSNARVKMITAAPGMHFVSTATLRTLLNQTSDSVVQGWIDQGTIKLSNKGNPVNYIPGQGRISASVLGPGLYFYAETHVDNYANRNVYWLEGAAGEADKNQYGTWDGGNPAAVAAGPFNAKMDVESDRDPWLSDNLQDPESDFWFLENSLLSAGTASDTYSSSFTVEKLDRNVGTTATLTVRLQGCSDTTHRVEIRLNGVLLGDAQQWFGRNPAEATYTFDATIPASLAESPTANQLTITATLASGVTTSSVRIDGYNLQYRRTYFATANTATPSASSMEAGVDGNATVSVPNFGTETTAPVILAFDVTDVRNLRLINNLRIDKAGDGTWRGSFIQDPATANMRFAMIKPLVNNSARVLTATSLSIVYPANLAAAANEGSYMTIAPSALLANATTLATYRAGQFRTKTVLVDDIFNEFNNGIVSPHAIRSFIAVAYSQWRIPPRYVTFIGDGTWDYRNRYGAGNNLLPPLMVTTPWGLATSDSLFGKATSEVFPRVVIGRLPIRLATQFVSIYNKIVSYEAQNVPNMKALLIADTPDAAGDFIEGINEVEHYLSPTFISQKVLPPPSAEVRTTIQTAMNAGVEVINYIGHGAIDRLGPGASQYFMRVNAGLDPAVANGSRLPILVVMTCVAGDFGHPTSTAVAEGYLREANAGAAAVIAPTGLSLDAEASLLNRKIMEFFSHNTTGRLGDAFIQSASLYVSGGARLTPLWIYNVIGDPALRLVTPP